MANWMVLQLNDGMFEGTQVVEAAALAATHEPQIVKGRTRDGRASFYGLGYNVEYGADGLVRVSHAGAFFTGVRTDVTFLPGEKLGIVVLANAFPTGVPEAIADAFFDDVLDGAPSRDWVATWNGIYDRFFGPAAIAAMSAAFATAPPAPAPALPLSAYVGTYANRYVGVATVSEAGGSLVLALGPDGAKTYPLRHFDRDTFVYVFSPELPELMSSAVFAIGPDQKAATLVLDDFGAGDAVLPRAAE
jgi:hypothetical protein